MMYVDGENGLILAQGKIYWLMPLHFADYIQVITYTAMKSKSQWLSLIRWINASSAFNYPI